MNNAMPLLERGPWSAMTAAAHADLLDRGVEKIFDPNLRESVLAIIEDVRERGDEAVLDALTKFDGCTVTELRVREEEFAQAREQVRPELLAAIRESIDQVRRFNEQLVQQGSWRFESRPGLTVGEQVSAIASAGLFVPSGKGSYPSVLVQLATPAVVAGVERIAVVVPPVPGSPGTVDPAVLIAADELGLRDVFRVNGPAGIAALAFGTATIPKVDKVCGPGSPPVACAQVEVQRFGTTSVMLLGPSESLIIADDSADVTLLAADLLNEAEHGPDSSSVLVTDSPALIDAVQTELAAQLAGLPEPRQGYARIALGRNGGSVLTADLDEAAEVANAYAPEHMQIATRDDEAVLAKIRHAGEVLLGQYTPVSLANYVIGCPASLPTSGYARVAGGITADAFRKRTAVARADRTALAGLGRTVDAYAEHEGFPAHRLAVSRRMSAL